MPKFSGVSNYKNAEVLRMLEIVGANLPAGKDEWERVASLYNSSKPDDWVERDYESLRRKFNGLATMLKPTGTPDMPRLVSVAKDIKRRIESEYSAVGGGNVCEPPASSDEEDCVLVSPVNTADLQLVPLPVFPSNGITVSAEKMQDDALKKEAAQFPKLTDRAAALVGDEHPSTLTTLKRGNQRVLGDTASHTRQKRRKAETETAAMMDKLNDCHSSQQDSVKGLMELMILLADQRHEEEDRRRQEDERRRREERGEREETRRQDRIREREEDRQRSQEFLALISAMTKK